VVFWVAAPCSLAAVHHYFGGTHGLHFRAQVRTVRAMMGSIVGRKECKNILLYKDKDMSFLSDGPEKGVFLFFSPAGPEWDPFSFPSHGSDWPSFVSLCPILCLPPSKSYTS
jgi:hypothetical protein